jgi:hypothetical protein
LWFGAWYVAIGNSKVDEYENIVVERGLTDRAKENERHRPKHATTRLSPAGLPEARTEV